MNICGVGPFDKERYFYFSSFQTCVFEDNYIFLGSRLGNSLLLRFSTKEQSANAAISDEKLMLNEQPSKKKKLDTLGIYVFYL